MKKKPNYEAPKMPTLEDLLDYIEYCKDELNGCVWEDDAMDWQETIIRTENQIKRGEYR